MCWMTFPEVHPIAHKTSCPEYCKNKQIELEISACAYRFIISLIRSFIYEGDVALQVGLCHHSITLYSWLFKQSYLELAQFM